MILSSKSYGNYLFNELKEVEQMKCNVYDIGFFDTLPDNLTYPDITPKLFPYALKALITR